MFPTFPMFLWESDARISFPDTAKTGVTGPALGIPRLPEQRVRTPPTELEIVRSSGVRIRMISTPYSAPMPRCTSWRGTEQGRSLSGTLPWSRAPRREEWHSSRRTHQASWAHGGEYPAVHAVYFVALLEVKMCSSCISSCETRASASNRPILLPVSLRYLRKALSIHVDRGSSALVSRDNVSGRGRYSIGSDIKDTICRDVDLVGGPLIL